MVAYRDLILKRQAREARKQDKQSFKRAVLTDEFGNQTGTDPLVDVWASESDRRVWYMTDGAVQPAQILCRKVSDPYVGLGVIIGYADGSNQLEVLSDDFFLTGTGDPTGWASTAPRDFEPGGLKQMWVYSKVITPLATYPGSGLAVNVVSGDYPYAGSRKTFSGSVGFALTQNPNAGQHYLAGLYLDAANTLQVVYGASVVVATTPPEPSWPAGAFRLSAVRVNDTQTSIDFADDVFDRRMAWSDEQAGGGWPFANVLTVSTTDPDADYDNVTDAITAASAGDGILLDMESSSETITVNKAIYLIGWARGGTVFTSSITITAAARLYNIKVDHTAAAARGFICNQTGVAVLYNCEAVTSGSATSRAIEQTAAGSTQVYGGYYESSGAGTSFEVFVSAGSVVFYNTPTLFTSAISGNAAGAFSNSAGGVVMTGGADLTFNSDSGYSSGVWLVDESLTLKIKHPTLAAAVSAAAAGDTIKLDTDTYSISAQQAFGVSLTIEGDGPEATIIEANVAGAAFAVNANNVALVLRNLTLDANNGAGILAGGVYNGNSGVTIILDNAIVKKTGGAPTSGYGVYMEAGTLELRNGSKALSSSGSSSQRGIYNATGAATIIIGAGCEVSGGTVDIFGNQTGSTLNIYGGLITHNTINFSGAIERSGNTSFERGRPNPVVNGAFQVWQRGTSFAAIANGTYSADRWFYAKVGVAVHTVSRSTDVPTVAQAGQLVPYSFLADCTTIDAAIAAGDFVNIQHRMEGYNWQHLAQRQITVSFWVKATKTGVYCFSIRNSGVDRSYVAEYTVNTTDTWEYKTITVLASPTAGTWDYTNGVGAYLTWALSCGTDFQTTANAWQTGNYFGTSNQVNATDDTANDFRLAMVKVEPGAIATPFALPDIQAELNRCLRYAWVLDASSNTATIFNGSKYATANVIVIGVAPVTMRTAPTLSHNITGYTAGAPGTTTVALFDLGTGGFKTITGALTVSLGAANTQQISLALDAATSWSGTAGDLCQLRIGPSVVAVLSAEL